MKARIPPRIEIRELHRARFQEWAGGQRVAARPKEHNAGNAARVDRPATFYFRGRPYEVPPITPEEGFELQDLLSELGEAGQALARAAESRDRESVQAGRKRLLAVHAEIRSRARRLMRPERGWRRLVWPLRRNPFRRATGGELVQMLDFFWLRLTGTRFLDSAVREAVRGRSTTSTPSTSSSAPTAAGPGRGGTTGTG